MYNVLIVDDEARERNIIKIMLTRFYEGQFEIFEAANGDQALECVDKTQMDLIFMDIRMPSLTGIEAIKKMRKLYNAHYIIIITAYNYFEYAKEAIDLGVKDYLLKPPTREAFSNSIEKFLQTQSMTLNLNENKVIGHYKKVLKEDLLVLLSRNRTDHEKLKEYFNLLNYDFKVIQCVVLKLDEGQFEYKEIVKKTYREKIQSYIEKELYAMPLKLIIGIIDEDIVFYSFSDEAVGNDLKKIIKRAQLYFNERYEVSFLSGIGKEKMKIENIADSFDEAMFSLNKQIKSKKIMPFEAVNYDKLIAKKIMAFEGAEAIKIFSEFVKSISEDQSDIDFIKLKTIANLTAITKQVMDKTNQNYYLMKLKYLIQSDELLDLIKFSEGYIENILKTVQFETSKKTNKIVNRVVAYIEGNYNQSLSTGIIARNFGVNSFYLSKLFKEFMGMSLIDFLTEVRINNALELMKNDEHNIKEIATRVGYQDPNYFSRVFKKVMGIGAKEYRKNFIGYK